MSWFSSKSKKRAEQIQIRKIHFLGEQDGVPERELKNRLIEFFQQSKGVLRAYLAQVDYGKESSVVVALCLRTQDGQDRELVEKIGKIFASMFGAHEYLDIIFLADENESELAKVSPPFFGTN